MIFTKHAFGIASYVLTLHIVDILRRTFNQTRNTSVIKGFQQLDSANLGFLVSVLQRKFDSSCFSEQWNQIEEKL